MNISPVMIFLRHASTIQNFSLPSREWKISEKGIEQAKSIKPSTFPYTVHRIFCSSEPKTLATIQFFAKFLQISPEIDPNLDEVKVVNLPEPNYPNFLKFKRNQFHFLDRKEQHNESCLLALNRFRLCVESYRRTFPTENLMFVSHGTILTLYFAWIMDLLSNGKKMFERWQQLQFCSWGVVQDSVVLKDIA